VTYPTGTPYDFWGQLLYGLAVVATSEAQAMVTSLMGSFGPSTEPDFSAVVPIYDRMLAIALLILGAIIAYALIERISGGASGSGAYLLPRTLAAVFGAYSGLAVVEYVCTYAALLATTWSVDLHSAADSLGGISPDAFVNGQNGQALLGLVMSAFLLTFLALLVYLELIVRAALVLVVSVFIPLVCVMAIWPRMAGALTHLVEFITGLLLSKFVVATAVYVGVRLLLPDLLTPRGSGGQTWMATGIAVLLIAAFSPIVLFQGLRFAQHSAGSVVRDLGSAGVGMAPVASVLRVGRGLVANPTIARGGRRLVDSVASRIRSKGAE
jgi:hypothetical protein